MNTNEVLKDLIETLYRNSVLTVEARGMLDRLSEKPKVKWVALDNTIGIPERSTDGSAGYDLISAEDFILAVGKRHAFGTGVTAEFPTGVCLDIRPRSGMAIHNGVTVLNADGLIDSDYAPKEIKVILINHGDEDVMVERGMRIAQGVFTTYLLAENDRCTGAKRDGGLGHTGR